MPSKTSSKTRSSTTTTSPWSVYILRCADNSLYTGVTTDLKRRLDEHNGLVKNGAKYTRNRQPVALVYQENAGSRSEACKRESAIKRLSKPQKEELIIKSQKSSDKKRFLDLGQVLKKP
jgi:putative endonuclease